MLKALLFAGLLAAPATAQDFDAALDDWLAGDDMPALRVFRDLAQAGDADARIFLGHIATRSHLWPAEVEAMPRKERQELLRAPGGLSGRSWMAVAAETDPRALAFDRANRVGQRSDALLTLMDRGEVAFVARQFGTFVSTFEDLDAALRIASHPDAPDAIAATIPGIEEAIEAAGEPYHPGHRMTPAPLSSLDIHDIRADPGLLAGDGARARRVPGSAPFVDFCSASCDETEVNQCLGAIWWTVGQDPTLVMASPSEGLLPTSAYHASPRIGADVARAIDSMAFRFDQTRKPGLASLSSCTWDGVEAVIGPAD